jgi:hypothetical protein
MTRLPAVLATVALVAVGSISVSSTADARIRGRSVAAGVLGLAAGAAIAGAAANAYAYSPGYYYGPGYAYAPGYGYPAVGGGYYGYAPYYGYGYPSTGDIINSDPQLQGTR